MAGCLDRSRREIQSGNGLRVERRRGSLRGVLRRILLFTGEIQVRLALLAMLFASYFGSLWAGSLNFPHGYDWRKNVISNLLSPRDNPDWYWLPSMGVALAGVCMLPLAAWIENELGDGDTRLARRVRRPAFLLGIGCLILSALVVPQHVHTVLGLRHAHEMLARSSAVGLGVGMLCACQSPMFKNPDGLSKRLRVLRLMWRLATLPPIAGAVGSGVVVALARLHSAGGGAAATFRGTMFWHLAFWEWAGSAGVFLFFASAVTLLRNIPARSYKL